MKYLVESFLLKTENPDFEKFVNQTHQDKTAHISLLPVEGQGLICNIDLTITLKKGDPDTMAQIMGLVTCCQNKRLVEIPDFNFVQ